MCRWYDVPSIRLIMRLSYLIDCPGLTMAVVEISSIEEVAFLE